jgi:hypothetical protein
MNPWNEYKNIEGLGYTPNAYNSIYDAMFPSPANAANSYFQQIPSTITPYYQPYVNAGNQALPQLQNEYNTMMYDPNQIISRIGSGYQESPGYQWSYDEAMKAANNAAAAGGMLGTPQSQQESAELATNLANQDYYNYLNHGMNIYNQGVSGTSDLNQMGYKASTDLAENLARELMSQGRLSYVDQISRNKNTSDLVGAGASTLWGLF